MGLGSHQLRSDKRLHLYTVCSAISAWLSNHRAKIGVARMIISITSNTATVTLT